MTKCRECFFDNAQTDICSNCGADLDAPAADAIRDAENAALERAAAICDDQVGRVESDDPNSELLRAAARIRALKRPG